MAAMFKLQWIKRASTQSLPLLASSGDAAEPSKALLGAHTETTDEIVETSTAAAGGLDANKAVEDVGSQTPDAVPERRPRLSFSSFAFFYGRPAAPTAPPNDKTGDTEDDAEADAEADDADEGVVVSEEATGAENGKDKKAKKVKVAKPSSALKKVEKRAFIAASTLRDLIIGPFNPIIGPFPPVFGGDSKSHKKAKNKIRDAKMELLDSPEHANRVIAHLRNMEAPNVAVVAETEEVKDKGKGKKKGSVIISASGDSGKGPIHGACLDCTDAEADKNLWSRLTSGASTVSVAAADLSSLIAVLQDAKVVSLFTAPDLGFGQPPNGKGILAGSVPSSGIIVEGLTQVGQSLLALGFAATREVAPSHVGIYPPKDRISVITYWWGYELCLPHASMHYLSEADSISHTLINFLTAYAMFNNGVREILPFIRYISQFVDFEWGVIKDQDKGNGAVCAATWVMPAALVPRPWDFPDPPPAAKVTFTTTSVTVASSSKAAPLATVREVSVSS